MNGLSIVVLSCGDLGIQVANRLVAVSGVERVTLVTTPYRSKKLGLVKRVARTYRHEGLLGLSAASARRVLRSVGLRRDNTETPHATPIDGRVACYRFADFHDADCTAHLRLTTPDLGVVAGTYILQPAVFEIPRLGCINLHMGKAPAYRGSAPAFWELYHGEREVGITIHRVARTLDAGNILLQEAFPIDPAPFSDPLQYVERYREEVLRPNGVRMLVDAVARLAANRLDETVQDPSRARTFRMPDHAAIRELRRRVAARRGAMA
jgi:methionyl-tRNA formyltransferase